MHICPGSVCSQPVRDPCVPFEKLTENLFFYPLCDLKIKKKKKKARKKVFWFLISSSGFDHLQSAF